MFRASADNTRPGFTLVEMLVVIAILGVLSSLVAPAVQRARESARRTQCLNNLRQLGLALEQHENQHQRYPPGFTGAHPLGSEVKFDFYSPQARLLPFLEQAPLYNSINFEFDLPERPGGWGYPGGTAANTTAAATRVAIFLCPTDYDRFRPGINYRGNMGVGYTIAPTDDSPESGTGLFFLRSRVSSASIRDGASYTVAFSEKLRGDAEQGYFTPESDYWYVTRLPWPATPDRFAQLCGSLSARHPPHHSFVGRDWMMGGTTDTLYNHGLTPNSAIPDCGTTRMTPPLGLFAARSWHHGGVNIVTAGGEARFVSDRIDLQSWHALSTRAGGEMVSEF